MEYAFSPETFKVSEIFSPRLAENGEYYYYLLEKKGISHSQAVKRIGVRAWFCGIKDKNASTAQWFCTNQMVAESTEPDFKIKFMGQSNERIHVGAHKGNYFEVEVKLSQQEQQNLKRFAPKKELVCNYFGEQRFDEGNLKIINELEQKDYEGALKLFLTGKSAYASEKSGQIKGIISESWGNWEKISQSAEIASTGKKALFEFLAKNPRGFEEAFGFVEQKQQKILLKAWQAKRFNEKLVEIALEKKPRNIKTLIIGQFGQYPLGASKAFPRSITIAPNEFEKKFRNSRLERKTFFAVEKFRAKAAGEGKFWLNFRLGRGEYATVFLKYLQAWLENAQTSPSKKINKEV